jgi:hypothetical protein
VQISSTSLSFDIVIRGKASGPVGTVLTARFMVSGSTGGTHFYPMSATDSWLGAERLPGNPDTTNWTQRGDIRRGVADTRPPPSISFTIRAEAGDQRQETSTTVPCG